MSLSRDLKSDLEAHWKEGRRLLAICHPPGLDELEFVRKTLPLASQIPLPPANEVRLRRKEDRNEQERERILQQRADAYLIANYISLLETGTNVPENMEGNMDTETEFERRICEFWDSISQERAEFRTALELVLLRKSSARDKIKKFITSARDEMGSLQRRTKFEDKIVPFPLSARGLFGHVLNLLLDESNGLGAALRKCRLEECGDFFLSFPSPNGGPIPAYCVPDHRLDAAELTKSDRNARFRLKKKRAKKKQRKNRGRTSS